jgi:putative membrane protein
MSIPLNQDPNSHNSKTPTVKVNEWLGTGLTGIAMGAADVVPGVSGGTIAFISGRYERLIEALSRISPSLLIHWKREGFVSAWNYMDGSFLATLFSGVLLSILSLAKVIHYALEHHGQLLWGFFFGLILASGVLVSKGIKTKTKALWLPAILGAGLSASIGFLPFVEVPVSGWGLFLGGAIAISAMILPGISGSFLLLVMGLYSGLINALNTLDWSLLGAFMLGAGLGLLSFVRLLQYLLDRFHDPMLAFLTGIMLGALVKVWPWKQTLSYRIDSQGVSQPFKQSNVLPHQFESLTGETSQWVLVLLMACLGMVTVVLIEWLGNRFGKRVSAVG